MKILPKIACLVTVVTLALMVIPHVTAQGFGLFGLQKSPVVRKAKKYNLVLVTDAAPGVFVDMRYKVTSVAGKALYPKDMPCLIHKESGKKLRKVQNEVARQGYSLLIWDAWRPPEAHMALWEAVKDPKFVVPPEKGLSWHCYGISVDLTLVRPDGSPCKMPTDFDELTDEAASKYTGNDPEVRRNLTVLQTAMRNAGFRKINDEWWHFDDPASARSVYRVSAADLRIRLPL